MTGRELARWLAVIPAAIAGWYAAVILGLLALEALAAFCPEEETISDLCVAPWYRAAEKITFPAAAGLAGTLVVLGAALAAPRWKGRVAWIAFLIGAMAATAFAVALGAWIELGTELAGGALALAVVSRIRRP